jgi:hypothetical protein
MRKHVPPRRDNTRAFALPVPAIWLNLVCLDAPIVSVVWLWLFARIFEVPLQLGHAVALFLTAWLIYLADRLADAVSLKSVTPRSLRQEFCLKHREIWISALLLIGGFDLYVIWRSVAAGTFFAGAVVGLLAVIYLALNHPRGLIWRSFPIKEFAIGLLFTAGTLVALLPGPAPLGGAFIACGLAFACLCSLNCISIARWERELDRAQGKISVATCHPRFVRHARKIGAGLAFISLVLASVYRPAAPILRCVAVGALLLALLDRFPGKLGVDQRTAMADLVLLTPIVPLVAMAS